MSSIRAIPLQAKRAVSLLLDRQRPWRRDFVLLNAARRSGRVSLEQRSLARIRRILPRYPEALVPYFAYLGQDLEHEELLKQARDYCDRPGVNAETIVEIAKVHYVRNASAHGDALLERAKELDPNCARIYEEEAWNQRARGNIHREIAALLRCSELAESPETHVEWEMWLGEAYLRLRNPELAWPHFQRYRDLPAGSDTILSAAYCAVQVGDMASADEAYRWARPLGQGFDRVTAAEDQLGLYARADEALRLIQPVTSATSTRELQTAYLALIRRGQTEEARQALEVAAQRPDRSAWVRNELAQLVHIIGDSAEAITAYESVSPVECDEFTTTLLGSLYAERGDFRQAASTVLASEKSTALSPSLFRDELDPMVPELLVTVRTAQYPRARAEALGNLLGRLSEITAISPTAVALGRTLFEQERWDEAWRAVRQAQLCRLPAISLAKQKNPSAEVAPSETYAEWCETEPIRPEVVLYETSLGDTTSCNPLAICLELLDDPARAELIHVWAITDRAVIAPELRNRPNVMFVRKGSTGHLRYLATAGWLINNATWDYHFSKRQGQRALNTWHGVPWKKLGLDQSTALFGYGNVARSLLHADLIIAPEPHTIDVLSRGMAIEELKPASAFVRTGYPRNDLSLRLSSEKKSAIRRELGLSDGEQLVLFMPTWKGMMDERNAEVHSTLDAVRAMGGDSYVVALRAHHYVRQAFAEGGMPDDICLVPDHLDTNQLIGAADVVVTDFSSVLFDAAAVGVPVVTLVEDIEQYSAERGLYFAPEEVPGQQAADGAAAARLIRSAIEDPAAFKSKYAEQTARFSFEETGDSARRVIELFFDGLVGSAPSESTAPEKQAVYLATSGLPTNGITRALRSLIAALDGTEVRPYLSLNANSLATAAQNTLADVRRYAKVLPAVGGLTGTRMEREARRFFLALEYTPSDFVDGLLSSGKRREARRLFAHTTFHAAVEFSAYDPDSVALVARGVRLSGGRRGVLLHSEMQQEVETRYPRLRSGLSLLNDFDFIASVSDNARKSNEATLEAEFGVPVEKHITLDNVIVTDEIRSLSKEPLSPEDAAWYAQEGVHVCAVSRLSPEKNHLELLEAFASTEFDAPLYLTLLGDGPMMHELSKRVTELGISSHVRLRGIVDNPYSHIHACDALILTSRYEGQGLVLLEALTLGTPVVSTDIAGPRSVLQDGKLGVLVPLSLEGIAEGLSRIVSGELVSPAAFDADEYARTARDAFLTAIGAPAAPASDRSLAG